MCTISAAIDPIRPFGRSCLRAIKRILFADTLVPQEFMIGLEDPLAEIRVWLITRGASFDITERYTTACTAPLKLCIGFHDLPKLNQEHMEQAVLIFCERARTQHTLGEIRLRPDTTISIGGSEFVLFGVRGCTNRCLPVTRLWAHNLLHAYSHQRRKDPADIRMTLRDEQAAAVTFIRPHPLCLASVGSRSTGNIFTMNLMGDLGNGYFGFALRDQRIVADVVKRAGRIAVSGLPFARCALAYEMAANYKKEFIDWEALSFKTTPSPKFGIPIPEFATGVRELELVKLQRIGSHRLFLSRIVHEEPRAGGMQACAIHGFYQSWRAKHDAASCGFG